MTIKEQIHQVKRQSARLAASSNEERNELLSSIAKGLLDDWDAIVRANALDLSAPDIPPAVRSRLVFSEEKRDAVIKGISEVSHLPDLIGKVLERRELDSCFILSRISVPLGVIGMVFEARPDALVQIVSLAVKSGNGIVLKGGSEAMHTNQALAASIMKSAEKSTVGNGWILLLTSREEVGEMLTANGDIDLIIPRGSNTFVSFVMRHTTIPVLGHSSGICHLYVSAHANLSMASLVAVDPKPTYPAACNAIETLLVDRSVASSFIPLVATALREKGVVIHGDKETCALVPDSIPYKDGDWGKEYLALELNIHVVSSLEEAMTHINTYGSHHTDAIITEDKAEGETFQRGVDSADVFVNCSTRFSDGYRFGLGAEVGISTSKVHARGPVGLSGLMSSKWLLSGHGELVATYTGKNARPFTHKELPL